VVRRFDGTAWRPVPLPTTAAVRGAWAAGPEGPMVLVGDDGMLLSDREGVFRSERRGATADLFARPAHPYTRGLLASLPHAREAGARAADAGGGGERLFAIPGAVPALTELPAGCKFRPRCPDAFDRCEGPEPGLTGLDAGHRVRCYLHEGAAAAAPPAGERTP